ncbi:MAG: type III pantothenate kinase [Nitrospirae bacterium]|nr:type III pantothenate kinase [Nitrospirota bacterium]
MLLLIDIGNTNITMCFYDKSVKHVSRLNTTFPDGHRREAGEYTVLLKGYTERSHIENPEGAVISSVVPELTPVFADAISKSFGTKPMIVSYRLKTGLKFRIKNPAGLGADRIANAVAAHKLYKGHLLVVDFGTATTFCVITSDGEYLGGAIMPGINISAEALHEKTAKLPKVKLNKPEKAIGDDTPDNISSGVILGHAGAVERLIKEIRKELAKKVTIIATGGLASLVAPYIKDIKEVNPYLTFEGLRLIYELNA